MPINPIFCAIDTTDVDRACFLASALKGVVGGLKLGMEFFYSNCQGAKGVDMVREAGCGLPLFLDFKFHDIPNTVAAAVCAVESLQPYMINVHASGGRDMMLAAVKAAAGSKKPPLVVAVTVLTSLTGDNLKEVGIETSVDSQVERLALLAQECGMDGVVCSAHEIGAVRKVCGSNFKLVVPGLRPPWAATNDQKRVQTPREALAAGADILVIGRPITEAPDVAEAARRIFEELK